MNPLDWARERARQLPQQQSYVRNPTRRYPSGQSCRTTDLDGNELGKLFATLQRRGREEVTIVLKGLTSTNRTRLPQSGFARRSNNKWLGLLKVLQAHVFDELPAAGADGRDDIRAVRWLRRLREVKEKNRAL